MSFSTLGIGVTGLNAAQKAMEVTAHNLANVNTEGYTRQRAELTTTRPRMGVFGRAGSGMLGTGVQVADIERIRSSLTDRAYRSGVSDEASWTVKADLLQRAEQVLGPLEGGLNDAVSAFWSSWDQLSLTPDSLAARRGVLDAGTFVGRWLASGAAQLDGLAGDVRAQMAETVTQVNLLAKQVGDLNAAIFDAVTASNAPNDLMDERDRVIDQLSQLTGATARPQPDGTIDVFVGSHALVEGEQIEQMTVSSLTPLAVTWQADGQSVQAGGSMAGLVELANDLVPTFRAELDAIAVGLRDLVNAGHTAGFDQDGNAGIDFFVGAGAADLAVNPAVGTRQVAAAATAAGAPADGQNALVIAGLRSSPAVGSESVGAAVAALAGRLGSAAASARSNAMSSAAVTASLRVERAEVSSVSIDEELSDMIRFQRAYEASARVITTVDEMLDKLINGTGLVGR